MFQDDERSNRLRRGILNDVVGQLLNDEERAKHLGLPPSTRIRERAKVISQEHLKLGEHCWIGEGALLDASGGLEIGDHVSIGPNCLIFTHSSWLSNMMLENYSGSELNERRPISIGRGVFIGGNSVIMPGVRIGERATVQPLSVVTKDVPAFSMAAGTPARVLREYDEAYLEEQADRVRTENRRRRELAAENGADSGADWGSVAGDWGSSTRD